MSSALSLMQALLGPAADPRQVEDALQKSLLSEVDPMHWCAAHLRISDAEIMRRAAGWAGLTYLDTVPRAAGANLQPARLEVLSEVRLYRLHGADLDVAFTAPDFFGLLRLVEGGAKRPDLRRSLCLVPAPALRTYLAEQAGPALLDNARQAMVRFWPHAAAQLDLTGPVRKAFVILLLALTLLLILAPLTGQGWLAPLWIGLVLLPTALRLLALGQPPEQAFRGVFSADERWELPVYSVLVPLRDEANMVEQLVRSLGQLDYPPEKLDIVFVVEGRSSATVSAVREHLDDPRLSLLVVPDALPRTKPKALDYALPLCRGEFVVVFDAEDRPEADQLLRIVEQFRQQSDVGCIQARLVVDNGRDGIIPALFAGEYAGLFAVLLPALTQWGFIAPLGGTSNHFRTALLRELGGWDAFNVTEDADMGVRLARRRLRCATSLARTYEAAPARLSPWLGQRTRWMKGWMQTYVVHNRRPGHLLADLGWRGTAMLHVILLGMLLAPLLHVGFAAMLVVMALSGQLAWPSPSLWPISCALVLVMGHMVAILTNLVGLARIGQSHLRFWQVLLPVYWAMIGLATLLALREFAVRPFHWFKSPHQATLAPAADQAVGNTAQRRGRKPILDRSTAG